MGGGKKTLAKTRGQDRPAAGVVSDKGRAGGPAGKFGVDVLTRGRDPSGTRLINSTFFHRHYLCKSRFVNEYERR